MLKVAGAGALTGSLNYQGTWDASTNTPTLASGVGTKGYYYVVSTAGTTNLDGITDWQIGDWAVYSGTAWQKVDNSETVYVSNVATGTGLTGGPITTTGTIAIANTTVVSATYGNASTVAQFEVNPQGQLVSASNQTIAIGVAAVSGAVPNTVNILTSGLASGGGALTGNVTITVNDVPAANVTGLGTMATQNANAVAITGGDVAATNVSASNVTITTNLNANLSTSSSATFATDSLPLVPEGYLIININGASKKLPYYGA